MDGPAGRAARERRAARQLAAALAVVALAAALTWAGLRPPAPRPADAPKDQFSAGRAARLLATLYGGLGPHPVGSPANAGLRDRIRDHLASLGYDPVLTRDLVCRSPRSTCAVVENLMVRIEGEPGRKAVLLSTHYDSVPAGPGVSDAGVSVAAVLEIARVLRRKPPGPNPVILFIGDGEEAGLLGARAFVERHPWARQVGAVVNLEARGSAGRSWMFETSDQGAWLVEAYAAAVPYPATASVAYAIYKRLPTDTDLTVYRAAGLHGLGFAFIGGYQHYHTPLDSLENLSPGTLQQQGANALAMVRRLASMDLDDPPAGEAVFFDLFGRAVARWPASVARGLGWLSLALTLAAAAGLVRRGLATAGGILRGTASWLLTAVAAGGAGWVTGLLLDTLGVFPTAYPAHPWAALGAAWAAGAAAAVAVPLMVARRTGPRNLMGGGAVAWGMLAAGLTLLDPALSYLGVVPALLAGTLLILAPGRRLPGSAALLVPLAGGAVVWLQLTLVIFGAMGRLVLPAVSLLVGLLLTLAVPPVADLGRAARRAAVGVPLLVLAALVLVAALLPAWTEARPRRMSLAYHLEAGSGEGRWVLFTRGAAPAGLDAAAETPFLPGRAAPWWEGSDLMAGAPRVDLPAPVAEPLDRGESGGDDMQVRLRSPRGAPTLDLVLPRGSRVTWVEYPGLGEAEPGEGTRHGTAWESWRFLCVPPEGITVEIRPGDGPSLNGWVMDRSSGLPAEGEAVQAARPAAATPSQWGDFTSVYAPVTLRSPAP